MKIDVPQDKLLIYWCQGQVVTQTKADDKIVYRHSAGYKTMSGVEVKKSVVLSITLTVF